MLNKTISLFFLFSFIFGQFNHQDKLVIKRKLGQYTATIDFDGRVNETGFFHKHLDVGIHYPFMPTWSIGFKYRSQYRTKEDAWNLENRQGKPLFVGSLLCAIGQKESSATLNAVRRYYSYQGGPPSNAPGLPGKSLSASTSEILSTVTAIREKLKECEAAGMDEIFLRPAGVTDPDQVDRLAEAIL